MRILLIAYEFPPSASPQSLRWAYLTRELALSGHDVHVLTIDLGGTTPGLPALPDSIRIHRTWPGPIRGLVARSRKRRQRQMQSQDGTAAAASVVARGLMRPGWKLALSARLQKLVEYICFPDLRGEWRRWGSRALQPLLQRLQPDVVISSHEPATSLELGLQAKRAGFPWVADLADPVLAPYTLPHWHARATALEREVCTSADHVLVTATPARALLRERHGNGAPIDILTQGFDDRCVPGRDPTGAGLFDSRRLELLYTGSFYSFRRAEALIDAISRHPAVRLTIASISAPECIREACRTHPEHFRMLGFVPHSETLRLQCHADVLISIGNRNQAQVPGKIYEYLGAARPILHLTAGGADAPAQLIAQLGRGLSCGNDAEEIAVALDALSMAKQAQLLDAGFELDPAAVNAFGWRRLAQRLEEILVTACASGTSVSSFASSERQPGQ